MRTPPFYGIAQFFPRSLFSAYLNWAIKTEDKWNVEDKKVEMVERGHLHSPNANSCGVCNKRKYALDSMSNKKVDTIINERRNQFEYKGGIVYIDFNAHSPHMAFVKNGVFSKLPINPNLPAEMYELIAHKLYGMWESQVYAKNMRVGYGDVFDYAMNEVRLEKGKFQRYVNMLENTH